MDDKEKLIELKLKWYKKGYEKGFKDAERHAEVQDMIKKEKEKE